VRLGIDRADSTDIAAAAMAGAAAMISSGESPDGVRRKITTPGESTAAGLEFLQASTVASLMSDSVIKTSSAAGQLGARTKENQ